MRGAQHPGARGVVRMQPVEIAMRLHGHALMNVIGQIGPAEHAPAVAIYIVAEAFHEQRERARTIASRQGFEDLRSEAALHLGRAHLPLLKRPRRPLRNTDFGDSGWLPETPPRPTSPRNSWKSLGS